MWGSASRVVKLAKTSPFLRHNAVFLSGSLLVAGLNYLFYPVLSRMLNPADFGEVQTLTSLFTQAAIFLTILTYVTIHVTVETPDEQERNRTLLGLEKLAIYIGYGALLVALLCVNQLRTFLHFTGNGQFVALIVAIAISIPLAFRMAYLRGQKQFFRASVTDGVSSAGKLLLAPVLVLVGWRSFGAITALALAQVLSLVVGFVWARRAGFRGTFLTTSRIHIAALKPHLRHAGAVLLGAGGITLLQTLDIISVKHFFSPYAAGLYAGVTTIAGIVYFLMAPITGVLITLVSSNQLTHKNQARLKASLGLMLLVGGSALLVMSLFPEFVIKLLVGPKYVADAHYLPRVSLAFLLMAAANALMMYHIALKRYVYSLTSVVIFTLTLGLIWANHGTIGAVIDNIVLGSFLLLSITALQNFFLNNKRKGENV